MKKMKPFHLLYILLLSIIIGCSGSQQGDFTIDYEKYELGNGLDVILHQDDSDPVVALAILYHVGSSRETPGKTGFAHLFEHVLFQESENIPQDEFFKKIQDAGGTLNGGTSYDYTVYYEVVPSNALEKILWMESDRMGFVENTVTQSAFINQQNVVMNEKRQSYDNQPYGHTTYVLNNNIYPEGHPYNWTVIGEMADLKNATLQDVKDFYDSFYGPNNATLVLAGDFEADEAKELIERYFAEIPSRQEVSDREPMPVTLETTVKLVHEDNFATQPQLRIVWPTINDYSDDSYALSFLGQILAGNKKSPMYRHLVMDTKMTSNTSAYQSSLELAGTFNINLTANEGYTLDDLEKGVFESLSMFEEEGITETDLERIKAGLEMSFYNGFNSVYQKSVNLAYYNAVVGDPGFIEKDIENIQQVTIEDVMRVYEKYIKDKPFVATSFVPQGRPELAVANSVTANIVEEDINQAASVSQIDMEGDMEIPATPSLIDRSVEPELGPEPLLHIPEIWTADLENGMDVYGIEQNELPIVYFNLVLEGGFKADEIGKPGVANMVTDLMMEGTRNKTPEELEEEIDLLGANINMSTGAEEIVISGSTLSRNFDQTLELVREILLEPRWDMEQFELKKNQNINYLIRYEANPSFIASREFSRLIYGDDHIFGHNIMGNVESVSNITIEDLQSYYEKYFSPSVAHFHVAGDITQEEVLTALGTIETSWEAKNVEFPAYPEPQQAEESKIYFYDMPGSKQSVIYAGNLTIGRDHPDYYAAYVMNYQLGGSFNGILNMILREEKGYTYGASSGFNGRKGNGLFMASSSVQSNTTQESVQIFMEEMDQYKQGISEEDLEFTKNALIRSNARRFETLGSLVGMLQTISKYNFPTDYIKNEENVVRTMNLDQHQQLANQYLNTDHMTYLIVGDAETQLNQLGNLGLGQPITINN